MSRVRTMSLGQRSRTQLALKVCAFQIHVRPITSSCIVGFKNYFAEMIIVIRRCVACKNHVPRSKVNVTADTLCFGIPESCPTLNFIKKLMGCENYLAEMIITTRRCVRCKNHVVRSKVKVSPHTQFMFSP